MIDATLVIGVAVVGVLALCRYGIPSLFVGYCNAWLEGRQKLAWAMLCSGLLMIVLGVFATGLATGAMLNEFSAAPAFADNRPDSIAPSPALTAPCKVLSVHDGDTLKVRIQFEADIRLLDCWAPEITGESKPEGMKSQQHLQRLALGQNAIVHIPLNHENIGRATSMGRILGKVYVDGKDMSAEQVKAGFATETKQ